MPPELDGELFVEQLQVILLKFQNIKGAFLIQFRTSKFPNIPIFPISKRCNNLGEESYIGKAAEQIGLELLHSLTLMSCKRNLIGGRSLEDSKQAYQRFSRWVLLPVLCLMGVSLGFVYILISDD